MSNQLSIYVHWPFCLAKCPYCDFNSHVAGPATIIDHQAWLAAYASELKFFSGVISGKQIKSIFFGGGTPSLMMPMVVSGIIKIIAELAIIDDQTEISLEANPTSVEIDKLIEFRLAGVNRVSIGVQALNRQDLQALGRTHDADEAVKAIELARQLFPKSSFDLIYARTGQTLQSWQNELTSALALASGHISLYQLTIEKGTPFYQLFRDKILTLPDNDLAADMYEWTTDYLTSHAYDRYEISNYAQAGQQSQHNLAYWQYNNYLGIGPGAHSRISQDYLKDTSAVPNAKLALPGPGIYSMMMWHRPDKWLKSVHDFGCGSQIFQKLSTQTAAEELLMMGLRLEAGVDSSNLQRLCGLNITEIIDQKIAHHYMNLGLIEYTTSNLRLSKKGLMLHSYLVPRLLRG